MMSKQELLLTDEEIREVADNLSSDGHYFIWELAHATAKAQLAKALPIKDAEWQKKLEEAVKYEEIDWRIKIADAGIPEDLNIQPLIDKKEKREIKKGERERIIKVLTKRGLFDDFLCSEEKALKNNCPTCKMFWQALKESDEN